MKRISEIGLAAVVLFGVALFADRAMSQLVPFRPTPIMPIPVQPVPDMRLPVTVPRAVTPPAVGEHERMMERLRREAAQRKPPAGGTLWMPRHRRCFGNCPPIMPR